MDFVSIHMPNIIEHCSFICSGFILFRVEVKLWMACRKSHAILLLSYQLHECYTDYWLNTSEWWWWWNIYCPGPKCFLGNPLIYNRMSFSTRLFRQRTGGAWFPIRHGALERCSSAYRGFAEVTAETQLLESGINYYISILRRHAAAWNNKEKEL